MCEVLKETESGARRISPNIPPAIKIRMAGSSLAHVFFVSLFM